MLYDDANMRGRFIVLEGPDGAGTTTHSLRLVETLQAQGKDVLMTAEPTAGPIGTWVRSLIRSKTPMDPFAVQLLFCADRAAHASEVIVPALEKGITVISDRYWHSTVAYAEAQGLDTGPLLQLNKKFVQPDVVLFALPDIDVCLKRLKKRDESDLFSAEELQRRIHAAYHRLATEHPDIAIIDTGGEKDDVARQIADAVL
jgi:dTMP kinase